MTQQVAILGSTGSIGVSTLDVVARHPERFRVYGLSAQRRVSELAEQCVRFQPRVAVVPTDETAQALRDALRGRAPGTQVCVGTHALEDLAAAPEVDSVMAAIVGAAGLRPCMAAARAGKRLLLANKEAIVVGGELFIRAVREGGATLIPIDSEHSAIFQCLPQERSQWSSHIDHIVLTASGGPFRTREPVTLRDVTPEQAVAHPNWVMGRKISVDSATMMNKALEVIEARWLFDLRPEQIRVVIHPQSIIHSMVVCRDASVLAQLGTPDMRVPIAYGLAHPHRVESGASRVDFRQVGSLTFEEPDPRRFPGLFLAWEALAGPEGSTVVLNGANEIAVEAFLERRLAFTDIHAVNVATLEAMAGELGPMPDIEALLDLDARARSRAHAEVLRLGPP